MKNALEARFFFEIPQAPQGLWKSWHTSGTKTAIVSVELIRSMIAMATTVKTVKAIRSLIHMNAPEICDPPGSGDGVAPYAHPQWLYLAVSQDTC